jgi:2-hydroxy-6-oxonona-2,4-dienedioate hydrolase
MTPGRVFFWLIALLFILAAVPLLFFLQWRTERLQELSNGSFLISTLLGPIEYADSGGEGSPVLVLHAGGGGYDQGLQMAQGLVEAGHRVIAMSRPGYLRTPIASGVFPEQQADLAAILLRVLGLKSAGVLAAAEAAPTALQLALRHPDLIDRVALISPVVQRPRAAPEGKFSLPAEGILRFVTGDVDSWLLSSRLRWRPQQTVESLLLMETNLKPFPALQLSREISANEESMESLNQFFETLAPISPRETGIRNDIVQMRGLPEIPFSKVAVPVLLLRGENDGISQPENAELLRQGIPRIEEHVIPGAGFLIPGYGPSEADAREHVRIFFQK